MNQTPGVLGCRINTVANEIARPLRRQTSDWQNMKSEVIDRCNVCAGTLLESVDPACNIARCVGCGYVFDNPRPTLEELVKFYSRPSQYGSWLQELPSRQSIWERRLSEMQSTKKSGSLLDVGTGIGQFLDVARRLVF